MDDKNSLTSEEIHWAMQIMICKGGGRSVQDLEQIEHPQNKSRGCGFPTQHVRLCLCVCLYNQKNYFLLTTASSLTINDNFDKLASPRRYQDPAILVLGPRVWEISPHGTNYDLIDMGKKCKMPVSSQQSDFLGRGLIEWRSIWHLYTLESFQCLDQHLGFQAKFSLAVFSSWGREGIRHSNSQICLHLLYGNVAGG